MSRTDRPAQGPRRAHLRGGSISRVEGEGRLRVVVRGDEVVERASSPSSRRRASSSGSSWVGHPDEVIDIVARICGICPVAYQMTAAEAFERLFEVPARSRRSASCAASSTGASGCRATPCTSTCSTRPTSWATTRASTWRATIARIVERGLALKHAGVDLLALLGGRAVHPVSLRVGGFYRVPDRAEVRALRAGARAGPRRRAGDGALDGWLRLPDFERDPLLLSLLRPRTATPSTRAGS